MTEPTKLLVERQLSGMKRVIDDKILTLQKRAASVHGFQPPSNVSLRRVTDADVNSVLEGVHHLTTVIWCWYQAFGIEATVRLDFSTNRITTGSKTTIAITNSAWISFPSSNRSVGQMLALTNLVTEATAIAALAEVMLVGSIEVH